MGDAVRGVVELCVGQLVRSCADGETIAVTTDLISESVGDRALAPGELLAGQLVAGQLPTNCAVAPTRSIKLDDESRPSA